jgi:hypothetical protein
MLEVSAFQIINMVITNLSTAVELLSIALTERCAERQFGWPVYIEVWPEFLPECILQMQKV